MSRGQRLAFIGVAAVIAIVAIVIAVSSGGSDSSGGSASGPQAIDVVDGKPEGGVKVLEYKKGDRVELTINSDTADEVHIHGYDLMKDVERGGSVSFSFPANIDGEFEIELEDAKQQLASLRVEP
jgi:hypothetical protein